MLNWDEDKITKIKKEYPFKDSYELAKEFGISVKNLHTRARILKLKKIKNGSRSSNNTCFICKSIFVARSGAQKKCDSCKKCKHCDKQLNYSHKIFCDRKCFSLGNRGEKNPLYTGSKKTERQILHSRIEYKTWRKQVFERDNYTCQSCFVHNGYLEAHHIIPYCLDKSKVFDINNGKTLCRPCHIKTDTWGMKGKKHKRSQKNV